MFTIRKHVFETNSSMTHSLVICENDEYAKWIKSYESEDKENGYLFCEGSSDFLPYKEAIEYNVEEIKKRLEDGCLDKSVTKDIIEKYANGECDLTEITDDLYELYVALYEWEGRFEYETEDFEYTTKSGDRLTGFCYFGYDQ